MQVEVRHVGAELARPADADEGIQVGAVHIDLATGTVDDLADLGDRRLEHAVGRGISDHEGGDPPLVRPPLRAQVGHVDVALVVAGDDDHLEAGHPGTRRGWCRGPSSGSGTRPDGPRPRLS